MTIHNEKKKILTYEMICEAVNGDTEAESMIFDYYEPYIIKLSKIPFIGDDGQVRYTIDDDIYMSLKLKLHELILGFQTA